MNVEKIRALLDMRREEEAAAKRVAYIAAMTLTQNEMTARSVVTADGIYQVRNLDLSNMTIIEGKEGITVNAICPGFFPSKMTYGLLEQLGADNMAAKAPLRRLGDDEDLKGLVALYASDAGKHITGQWMAVDGGVSAIIGG